MSSRGFASVGDDGVGVAWFVEGSDEGGALRVEQTKFIMTHGSGISCSTLTQDGKLLTTTSNKGTLIRVFNTMDGSLLQEVVYSLYSIEFECMFGFRGKVAFFFKSSL